MGSGMLCHKSESVTDILGFVVGQALWNLKKVSGFTMQWGGLHHCQTHLLTIVLPIYITLAIMQNMIFDSVFEVDSVLENKSDF